MEKMYVYTSRTKNAWGQKTAIVVETNLAWAIPYWAKRKCVNENIHWEFK
jgi:hypothetical protein